MNRSINSIRELMILIQDNAFTRGPVTLSSGIQSDYYFDTKRVSLTGFGSHCIGMAFMI